MSRLRPDWRSGHLLGRLQRLADVGALPTDSEELKLRKAVLLLSTILMARLSFVWVGTYAALGLWVTEALPFAYQVASAISIYDSDRTRRYLLVLPSPPLMSLLQPYAVRCS